MRKPGARPLRGGPAEYTLKARRLDRRFSGNAANQALATMDLLMKAGWRNQAYQRLAMLIRSGSYSGDQLLQCLQDAVVSMQASDRAPTRVTAWADASDSDVDSDVDEAD